MLVEDPREKINDKFNQYYYELSGFFARLFAFLLNNLAILIVIFTLPIIFSNIYIDGEFIDLQRWNRKYLLLFFFIIALLSFLQLVFMYKFRQTIGKKIMGIRVVNYHSKQPISFLRYLMRELFDLTIFIVLIFPLAINIIMFLKHKEKRTFTDLIFSTVVVKDKQSI